MKNTPLERTLSLASLLTITFALLSCLPSLFVPIGFSAEGDAIDYRVPLMKWILRHHALPNWPWTYVDDFPLLGELLMLPFFAVKAELARLVPIAAYGGAAAFGAAIGGEFVGAENRRRFFLFAWASLLGLQPLLVQADHVMVDNIATCFALGSLLYLLRRRFDLSALLLAGALATRYMIWGAFPGAVLALLWLERKNPRRILLALRFFALAFLGAAPFLLRNTWENSNPFFPIFSSQLNGVSIGFYQGWGRGSGIVALLLFPFDLLYTNSFVRDLFDTRSNPYGFYVYKLGTLFYLQLAGAVGALVLAWRHGRGSWLKSRLQSPNAQVVGIFFLCHFLFWFFGSQQLRFFGCGATLLNLPLLLLAFRLLPLPLLVAFALFPLYSVSAVRQEGWRIAMGQQESFQASAYLSSARRCFERSGVTPGALMGYSSRDVTNGFFDWDFVYVSPNNLATALPGKPAAPEPDFIYSGLDFSERAGFMRWPAEHPCLLKRKGALN